MADKIKLQAILESKEFRAELLNIVQATKKAANEVEKAFKDINFEGFSSSTKKTAQNVRSEFGTLKRDIEADINNLNIDPEIAKNLKQQFNSLNLDSTLEEFNFLRNIIKEIGKDVNIDPLLSKLREMENEVIANSKSFNKLDDEIEQTQQTTKTYAGFISTRFKQALDGLRVGVQTIRSEFNSWSRAYTFLKMWTRDIKQGVQDLVEPFLKFQKGLNEVGALIRGNYDSTEKYNKALSEYGVTIRNITKITGDAESAYEGAYLTVSKLGEGAIQNARFMKELAEATVAGGSYADFTDVINLSAAAMKNFGLTLNDNQMVLDQAMKTVEKGDTNLGDLAKNFQKVSGQASTLNFSLAETNAIFATLTGVTGNTNRVGTQFKSVLSTLTKATDEQREAFNLAKIESEGFASWLNEVALRSKKGSIQLKDLFKNNNAYLAINALVTEQLGDYNSKLKEIQDSEGAMTAQYLVNAASIEHKTDVLSAVWENLKIEIVQNAAPAIAGAIDGLAQIIDVFTKDEAAMQKINDTVLTTAKTVEKATIFFRDYGSEVAQAVIAIGLLSGAIRLAKIEINANAFATTANTVANEANAVSLGKITVAQVAHKASTVASTVATQGFTVSIKAMTLAMGLTPWGAITIAIGAMAIGVVKLMESWQKAKIAKMEYYNAGIDAVSIAENRVKVISRAIAASQEELNPYGSKDYQKGLDKAKKSLLKFFGDINKEWGEQVDIEELSKKNYKDIVKEAENLLNKEQGYLDKTKESEAILEKRKKAREQLKQFANDHLTEEESINAEYERRLGIIEDAGLTETERLKRINNLELWRSQRLDGINKKINTGSENAINNIENIRKQWASFIAEIEKAKADDFGKIQIEYDEKMATLQAAAFDGETFKQEKAKLDQWRIDQEKAVLLKIKEERLKADREYRDKVKAAEKELLDGYKEYLRKKNDLNNESYKNEINDTIEHYDKLIELFEGNADLQIELEQMKQQKITEIQAKADGERLENARKTWEEQNRMFMENLDIWAGAYENFMVNLFDTEMSGGERLKMLWEDLRRSYLSMIAKKMTGLLKQKVLEQSIEKKSAVKKLAIQSATFAKEAAMATASSIKWIAIKMKDIAAGVAKFYAPLGPFAIPAIIATVAAIKGLINSFASGGYTGDGTGKADSTGERPAGIVHEKEFVFERKITEKNLAGIAEFRKMLQAGISGKEIVKTYKMVKDSYDAGGYAKGAYAFAGLSVPKIEVPQVMGAAPVFNNISMDITPMINKMDEMITAVKERPNVNYISERGGIPEQMSDGDFERRLRTLVDRRVIKNVFGG